ncbi:MAG TPA: hypothetical protein DCY40_09505 [Actinobacteria bacterium]|nr:hypothetical protein [Actinomycetota bacterium]
MQIWWASSTSTSMGSARKATVAGSGVSSATTDSTVAMAIARKPRKKVTPTATIAGWWVRASSIIGSVPG